jgi:hypothetical protein
VREITHVQVSWTEVEGGAPEGITMQLILDNGAEEYMLNPSVDNTESILRCRSKYFLPLQSRKRKILMFGNMPVDPSSVVVSLLKQL